MIQTGTLDKTRATIQSATKFWQEQMEKANKTYGDINNMTDDLCRERINAAIRAINSVRRQT